MGVKCCYGCTRRAINCHTVCPDYTAEAAQNAAERNAKNAIKAQESDLIAYAKKNMKARSGK